MGDLIPFKEIKECAVLLNICKFLLVLDKKTSKKISSSSLL